MNIASGIVFQVLQSVLVVLIAPLMLGWVNQCRAWLQNKSGAGVWQPYQVLNKLFHKDAVLAHNASPLFRVTPYILFGCMWLAVGIVPVLATSLPFAPAADVIALVGLFALARVFISLAGMDVGTSFGTLGARRETLAGLSGLGDLILTCGSPQSRNMSLGIELGKGHSLKDVLAKRLSVTEGVYTAGALVEMAAARGIDVPIAQAVHAVISGLATVDEAIEALLARPLRAEV